MTGDRYLQRAKAVPPGLFLNLRRGTLTARTRDLKARLERAVTVFVFQSAPIDLLAEAYLDANIKLERR